MGNAVDVEHRLFVNIDVFEVCLVLLEPGMAIGEDSVVCKWQFEACCGLCLWSHGLRKGAHRK